MKRSGSRRDAGWAWFVCFGAHLNILFVVGSFKSMGILLHHFRRKFGGVSGTTALTAGLLSFSMAFSSLLAAALIRRWSHRTVALVGSAVTVSGALLATVAPNLPFLVLAFGLVTGAGYGMLYISSISIIAVYFRKRRALANGLAMAGASVGVLSVPPVLSFLMENYGYRGALLVYSALTMNTAVAAALFRPFNARCDSLGNAANIGVNADERKQTAEETYAEETDIDSICVKSEDEHELLKTGCGDWKYVKLMLKKWPFLKNYLFISFAVAQILGNAGYVNSFILLPLHAYLLSVTSDQVSILFLISGLCDLFGRIFGGWFAGFNWIHPSRIVAVSLYVVGAASVLSVLFPVYPVLCVFAFCLGTFGGSYMALCPVLLVDFIGEEWLTSGYSVVVMLMCVFVLPFPTLLGVLRDVTGSYSRSLLLCSGMMLTSATTFLAFPFFRRLEEHRTTRHDRARPSTSRLVRITS